MAKIKALTDRSITERFREIKDEDELWDDLSSETSRLAKRIIESSLDDELTERLCASRYKRTEVRQGWRNGGYSRQLLTRWSLLDIWMPRAHKLPHSEILGRFRRHEPEVDQLI